MTVCCPNVYNLCIYQGGTFTRVFVWNAGTSVGYGPAGASPSPVDLTGYTATMQFRQAQSTTANLLYDASSNIVLGGTAGTITLTIPASSTELFTWWMGYYDLLLTDSSGNVTPLLTGQVNVQPAVST